MKLKDLISKVNKSKEYQQYVDTYKIGEEFGFQIIGGWEEIKERLTSYYVKDWYCTDSRVGLKIFFLDNEPVGISYQNGRKSSEDFQWISNESYNKTKEFLKTFVEEPEPHIDLCDLDEEVGETYKIEYHSQLFKHHDSKVYHEGYKVEIFEKNFVRDFIDGQKTMYGPSTVKIRYENGSEIWVQLKELDFKYNVIE